MVARCVAHNGGNFNIGADLKRLLREAGLSTAEIGAEYDNYSTPDDVHAWAQYSIRINDRYRLCFRWSEKGPTDAQIVDYH